MENAAQALKMSAWVLIFVVALTISINAFGRAKGSLDTILTYRDREYLTKYIPISGDTQRKVGFESIIPAIYRSFKENYKVVFQDYILYYYEGNPIKSIDLTVNGYADDVKEQFLERILFGISDSRFQTPEAKAYTTAHFSNIKFEGKDKSGNTITSGLYNLIKSKIYKESLGIYIPDEVEGATETPEANKKTRRVITYEEI